MEDKDELARKILEQKRARRARRLRMTSCPRGCREPIGEGQWRCPVHDPEKSDE